MRFRRATTPDLEPARRALAQARYEAAFVLLERAADRGPGRAAALLQLAAVYALYGADGVDEGVLELEAAAEADPDVVERPLYHALWWEFAAHRGEPAREVKRGVQSLRESDDPVARYHAASALMTAGAYRSALTALAELDEEALPEYLRWRRRSLEGLALEQLGRFDAAAEAYEAAVAGSTGADREAERLNLAGCLLELDRPDEVLELTEAIDPDLLADPLERADLAFLGARAQQALGNPNRSLELLGEAIALQREADVPTGDLLLARGQLLVDLERFEEAAPDLEEAATEDELRSQALHELAYVLAESDELDRARDVYRQVVEDEDYAFRGEALADQADLLLRRGDLDEARAAAERALEEGGPPTACLTLGSIAFEYFRLDEAVTWFERAAAAAAPGDPIWVQAQQLLADVFAQQLPEQAERLLRHARAALDHVGPHSDWYLPLQQYVEMAQAHLGGNDRVLN